MNTARVKFGLTLPFSTRPEDAVIQAVHAEALGFDSVWIGEHFARPANLTSRYPYAKVTPLTNREECFDPMAVLAAISSRTQRLRLCTGIYLLPLRHPVSAARSAATLQALSGGRFQMGLAAGWAKEEFDLFKVSYSDRGALLDEGLAVFRKALAGGDFEHDGKHYSFERICITNTPVRVPVIVGGASGAALRRAARYGDGWLSTPGTSLEDNIQMGKKINAMRQAAGRGDDPFTLYIRAPQANLEDVERYASAGLTSIVVGGRQVFAPGGDMDSKLSGLEDLARELCIKSS